MSTNRNKKGRLYLSNISFSLTSVNLEFSLKFSILTYKTLNDQAPLYLKKTHRALLCQTACLRFLVTKRRMGDRLLSCGACSQFGFWRQTSSLLSKLKLKLSSSYKTFISNLSADPESSLSFHGSMITMLLHSSMSTTILLSLL